MTFCIGPVINPSSNACVLENIHVIVWQQGLDSADTGQLCVSICLCCVKLHPPSHPSHSLRRNSCRRTEAPLSTGTPSIIPPQVIYSYLVSTLAWNRAANHSTTLRHRTHSEPQRDQQLCLQKTSNNHKRWGHRSTAASCQEINSWRSLRGWLMSESTGFFF